MLLLTSLRGSSFGMLDSCGSYFEESGFSSGLHGCLLRAVSFTKLFKNEVLCW